MKTAKDALPHYFAILNGREKAKYLGTDMGKKVSESYGIFKHCHFCERGCGVDRSAGQSGYCGVTESRIASKFIHWGEEPELIPSFTIFFSGCTLRCLFCQNWNISQHPRAGVKMEPELLADGIETVSALNVNWVGGDPTPNIYYIFRVLQHCRRNIAQVWNSNMYCTEEAMDLLNGVMDVYLTDFKYGNNRCAERLSDAKSYFEIVSRNHKIAYGNGEVLVRHLVLPNHFDCCTRPVLEWLAENTPKARVNVMDQYHPEWRASEAPELMEKPRNEVKKALDLGADLGLNMV